MAQWAYRSGSFVSAGNASGDSLVIDKPTGTASGDLIVFVSYWESDTNTITPPSGFTEAAVQDNTGSFQLQVWYKIAGGSEPSTYTFTPGTNAQWRTIVGAAYSGGTGSGPWVDVTGGAQGDAVAVTSQTAPSVSTTGADRLLIFGYGNFGGVDAVGVTGGASNFRGSFGGVGLSDAAFAAAGATGTTRPSDGPGTEDYAAIHVAFISDTGGGPRKIILTRPA